MRKFIYNTLVYISVTFIFAILIIFWQSSELNDETSLSVSKCIDKNDERINFSLLSLQGNNFEISFVKNSAIDCVNPDFPSIAINGGSECSAWLHMVYSDSKISDQKMFIDAVSPNLADSIYPFYTYGADFYDAPLWRYNLFSKPLSFWNGHAFAVKIDQSAKTIKYLGGISWGFKISNTAFRPAAIMPSLVSQSSWLAAWELFKLNLPGYELVQ